MTNIHRCIFPSLFLSVKIRVWVRCEVSFRVRFWVKFESEWIKKHIENSGEIKSFSGYKSFANDSDLIFSLQFMDLGEPDLEPLLQKKFRRGGLNRSQCIAWWFCNNLHRNDHCTIICKHIHRKRIFLWLSLRSKPYCLSHVVEASYCSFNCWTSSREAVNTNFYSL